MERRQFLLTVAAAPCVAIGQNIEPEQADYKNPLEEVDWD